MRESLLKFYLPLSAFFRENEKWIRDILLGGFLFFTLLSVVFHVKSNVEVPTYHIDGAFQTASSLFRLDAGHSVGKDFFPYLGIGIVYCLYPFYKLFGGDLMATTQAASFVCILSGAFVVAVPFALLRKRGNFRTLVFVFSLFLFLFSLSGNQSNFYWFDYFLEPGYSLRLLRSTLPYLVFLLVFFLLQKTWCDEIRTISLGVLAGISFLWSNDFAIPTVGVLFGVSFLVFWGNGWKALLLRGALMLLVSILTAVSLGMIICKGHYLDFLRYNFRDVAGDQFWYFGTYNPYYKISTVSDFVKKVIAPFGMHFCFLLFVIGLFLKTRGRQWLLLSAIGVTCLVTASLVQIGGHVEFGYSLFFSNWAWISVVAILMRVFFQQSPRYLTGFLCLLVVISAGASVTARRGVAIAKAYAGQNLDFTYVPEFGGYIENKYIPYLDFARKNKDAQCIELYWGLWSALSRRFDNLKVDSIIHARGHLESEWIEKIQIKPDFVVTTRHIRPEFEKVYQAIASPGDKQINIIFDKKFRAKIERHWLSGEFQLGNFNVNYLFYSILIRNYIPLFATPITVVWQRLEKPVEFPPVPVTFSEKTFILDAKEAGFYEVSCEIEFAFSQRNVLHVNSGVSYDCYPGFPLNPRQRPHVFPVYFDGIKREFSFQALPASEPYRILSCSARRIVLDDERVLPNLDEFMKFKKQIAVISTKNL